MKVGKKPKNPEPETSQLLLFAVGVGLTLSLKRPFIDAFGTYYFLLLIVPSNRVCFRAAADSYVFSLCNRSFALKKYPRISNLPGQKKGIILVR